MARISHVLPWSMAGSIGRIAHRWRWRSVLSQGGLVFIGYGLIAVLGMGALRLYTDLAPKSVFGQANLLLTLLTLSVQFFIAPFTNTQLRYYTEAQARGEGDAFTRDALTWAVRAAVVFGALAFLGCLSSRYLGGPALGPTAATCAFAWIVATSVRNVLMSRLQAERRRLAYTGLMIAEALLLGGVTATALYIAARTESYLAGQVFGALVFLVVVVRLTPTPLRRRDSGAPSRTDDFRAKALKYGLPFVPIALVGWLANLADRYVLGIVSGAAAVGQYVAPLSIASRAMIMASGALADLFRPVMFDAENRCQPARANRVFIYWMAANAALACAAVAFIAIAGQSIVGLLLGKNYREGAVPIMVWIAAGYGVYGLTQVLETKLLALGRPARLLLPMAAGAMTNIALSVALVPRHGVIGAAQASCLSFVAQSLVTTACLVFALRRRRVPV